MIRLFTFLFLSVLLVSCERGYITDKSPVHPNINFDFQPKYKAQKLPKTIPSNTVIWGDVQSFSSNNRDKYLESDAKLYQGKVNNNWVKKIPIDVDENLLNLGKKKYNINCAVCHTKSGYGQNSLITKQGWIVPSLHQSTTIAKTDGELYDIVKNGIRNMYGYGKVLTVEERWAIVAYVRALQISQSAKATELPEELKVRIK